MAERERESIQPGVTVTPPELESPEEREFREKLSDLLTDLIFDAQDVGLELGMLKCEKRDSCALVEKTRCLISRVRELFELQRKYARRMR